MDETHICLSPEKQKIHGGAPGKNTAQGAIISPPEFDPWHHILSPESARNNS